TAEELPSWTSSPLENNLPKLTLLPTEAKIRHTASNSLPRLGTSSIQKSSSNSVSPSSSSSYSAPGPARSARYRPLAPSPFPHGKYLPPSSHPPHLPPWDASLVRRLEES
ncbi:Uncharacterized protein FKW44_013465, partial [Caligus rogercresseyi]